MKVHEAGVGLPAVDHANDDVVGKRFWQAKPAGEAVARADVVAGEHVQAT